MDTATSFLGFRLPGRPITGDAADTSALADGEHGGLQLAPHGTLEVLDRLEAIAPVERRGEPAT